MFLRGRLRDLLGGCWGNIDLLLKRPLLLLLEDGLLSVEEPNMDSVSDGAAVLPPNRFMVMVWVVVKKKIEGSALRGNLQVGISTLGYAKRLKKKICLTA